MLHFNSMVAAQLEFNFAPFPVKTMTLKKGTTVVEDTSASTRDTCSFNPPGH